MTFIHLIAEYYVPRIPASPFKPKTALMEKKQPSKPRGLCRQHEFMSSSPFELLVHHFLFPDTNTVMDCSWSIVLKFTAASDD